MTPEWPCAMSMTSTSTPAFNNSDARSTKSPAPMAALREAALRIARRKRLPLLPDDVARRHQPINRSSSSTIGGA
jgi:hypothetical protein